MIFFVPLFALVLVGFILYAIFYLRKHKEVTPYNNRGVKGSARALMAKFESNTTLERKRSIINSNTSKF